MVRAPDFVDPGYLAFHLVTSICQIESRIDELVYVLSIVKLDTGPENDVFLDRLEKLIRTRSYLLDSLELAKRGEIGEFR